MKVSVLGNWGGCPQTGEATAGLLLSVGKRTVLLDCGSGVLAQLGRFCALNDIEAVFLTHYHHDHCADIGCLQYAAKPLLAFGMRRAPLPIYGHDRHERFAELSYKGYTVGHAVSPQTMLDLSGLAVSFAATEHEQYNLAMRFDYEGASLVYTGDMGADSDIDELCAGAGLLICECCFLEDEATEMAERDIRVGHMSTRDAGLLAQRAGVRQLMLTHFPHGAEGQLWLDRPVETRRLRERMAEEVRRYYRGPVLLSEMGKTYAVSSAGNRIV